MDKNVINLETYRVKIDGKKSKVFTGRDRGLAVRRQSNIDTLEEQCDTIHIIIPKDVYSINPSFFEELFVNVIRKLGKDGFLKKFQFTSEGSYKYEKPLAEAIERVLRANNALQ